MPVRGAYKVACNIVGRLASTRLQHRRTRVLTLSRKHFTGIPQRYIPFETLDRLHSGPSLEDFLKDSDEDNNLLSRDPSKAGRTENSRTNAASKVEGKNLGQKYVRNPKSKNRKPSWLKMEEVAKGSDYERTRETVKKLGLATVCEEAQCPNIGACWGGGKDQIATATIMLMGDSCTRACRFCSVKTSKAPPKLDETEPYRVGKAILDWGLKYVVLTSVDRDDYDDGGANHIASTVEVLKSSETSPFVEVLTPDFQGNKDSIARVVSSGLDVFAHNIEAVKRLTPVVRDRRANYQQSLDVLNYAKNVFLESKEKKTNKNNILLTKSSIMLGFGETQDEVLETMRDLREIGNCDVVTLGQYLQPTRGHLKVTEYVTPEMFEFYKQEAEKMGFLYVASGPLVRSSYKAGEYFVENYLSKQKQLEQGTDGNGSESTANAV